MGQVAWRRACHVGVRRKEKQQKQDLDPRRSSGVDFLLPVGLAPSAPAVGNGVSLPATPSRSVPRPFSLDPVTTAAKGFDSQVAIPVPAHGEESCVFRRPLASALPQPTPSHRASRYSSIPPAAPEPPQQHVIEPWLKIEKWVFLSGPV